MAGKDKQSNNTGLTLVITYFVLYIVNSLVILLANTLFPENVVLGTACLSLSWAIVHSMGTLAIVNTFAIPLVREYEKRAGRMLPKGQLMLVYFILNTVSVWVIARFAEQFGLGISSWIFAVLLAIVFTITQSIAMSWLEKAKTKNS
jgi:predicted outer membrane lipoprotein